MTRSELIVLTAQQTHMPETQVVVVLDTVLDTIVEALSKGDKVTLSGFGRFEMRERAPKIYVNPRTKLSRQLAPTRTPGFRPSKVMKERAAGK